MKHLKSLEVKGLFIRTRSDPEAAASLSHAGDLRQKNYSVWILGSVRKKEDTDRFRLGHYEILIKVTLLLQLGKKKKKKGGGMTKIYRISINLENVNKEYEYSPCIGRGSKGHHRRQVPNQQRLQYFT